MGTWSHGLLDNDTAMDGLTELDEEVIADIVNLGAEAPSPEATATLGAAVGVLLQLSPYFFGADTESGPAIVAALRAHAAEIAKLPAEARSVLEAVAAGEGAALAERRAPMAPEHVKLLCNESGRAPFGLREAALFTGPAAAHYVQSVADRCFEMLDEDFDDESTWCDLCREAPSMGGLAALLVLEPCRLPREELASYREKAQEGLASLVESGDEELDFQRGYYANLDAVFGLLEARAS